MPIDTKRIEGLPAVIATFTGYITADDVEQMYQDTEALLNDVGEQYFRISDVREADTSFPDFIKIIGTLRQDGQFRTNDPNMKAIFVGNNSWIHNYRNIAQNQGITMPAFQSMKNAMEYIALEMAKHSGD